MASKTSNTTTITDENDTLRLSFKVDVNEKKEATGPLSITLENLNNGCKVDVPPGSKAFQDVQDFLRDGALPGGKPNEKIKLETVTSNEGSVFM